MKKYLHVAFQYAEDRRIQDWESVFDTADDWLRYAGNCWILYTSLSPEEWYNRIKPHLKESERFLICELVIGNRQGWMNQFAWEWLNKLRY